MVVKPLLEGIFAILINMNLAPRVTLSITKVLWGIIGYSTFLLPNYSVSTDMGQTKFLETITCVTSHKITNMSDACLCLCKCNAIMD
jgi:hypothetical protein